jgi:hypothetical protein
VGRPRNPERDNSLQRYIDSDGEISTAKLAQLAGVPEARIRKWKSEDHWEEKLKNKPKQRGGQKGNKNAAGKTPAKQGNKNAVTHGAYAQAGYEDIDPAEAERIKGLSSENTDAMGQMMEELQALYVRRAYLEGLLHEYEAADKGSFYTDKIVHMIVPKSVEERATEEDMGMKTSTPDPEGDSGREDAEQFKTAMKSVIKSSPFDRAMKVEAELNRLHGRIIKQLDSIKAYELDQRRLTLEEKKFALAKQKLTGEIEVDDDGTDSATGEVDQIIDQID